MIFDTHAHYDDHAFDGDREELLSLLPSCGIGKVVDIGASMRSSRSAVRLSEIYDYIYAAVGVHPDDCGQMTEADLEEIRALAGKEKTVAIGEIGLDYHGFDIYEDKPSKETQMLWFRKQLELAAELDLPAVIHSRNACEDTLSTMRWAHDSLGLKKAVIHCFSYSKETAMAYLDLDYYLGFGGSTTYEGQKKISKVLNAVPLERILLETDCPYLTPVPNRGDRNDSRNLTFVRDRIAEIRGEDTAAIEKAAWENGCRFYGFTV